MQAKIQQKSEVPNLFTLSKFADKHSSFITLSALTNQIFKASPRQSTKGEIAGNGMLDYGVIVRIGRRILINEANYFCWLESMQERDKL
ncbi:MAG: hypothetical protein ACQ9ET_00800 [Nitrosomonadaceae bacterium]